MIIKLLLEMVKALLNLLTLPLATIIHVPSIPDSVMTVLNAFVGYFTTGIDVIRVFIGSTALGVVATCLSLILIANAAYFTYSVVWWGLKKIPFLALQ